MAKRKVFPGSNILVPNHTDARVFRTYEDALSAARGLGITAVPQQNLSKPGWVVVVPYEGDKYYFGAGHRTRNPATPKARRYVAKKITRLAREGVPPEQRVAEALSMARRAGYRSIPKRPARSNPFSEKQAWEKVHKLAKKLQAMGGHKLTDPVAGVGRELSVIANTMLTQLGCGIHENPRRRTNPALGLIANEAPAVFTISTRVKEIVYIHSQDGEEYVHPFAAGVSATFLQDGRCVLWRRDGKPVGGRRIGRTIRPIGG